MPTNTPDTNPTTIPGATPAATAQPAAPIAPIAPRIEKVEANQSTVAGGSTVSGQMDGLLKQDSSYMSLARQQGARQSASRGLLNSSMAAGNSMAAATQAALPIAQQDASTSFQNQRDNDGRTFAANQQNAQAQTNANMTVFDSDSKLFGSQTLNNQQFGQQQVLNAQQFGQQQALNTQQDGFAQQSDVRRFDQQQQLNTQQAQIEQDLQAIRGQQSVDLAMIESNYKNLLQTSASAQEMWKEYNNSINELVKNKDLTANHIKSSVQVQKDSLEAGLGLLTAISGIDLGEYASLLPTITGDSKIKNGGFAVA
jgi:hypothetical protein